MNDLFSFLKQYIEEDIQIRISGDSVTIRETDPNTRLTDIALTTLPGHSLFAFIMDRQSLKICQSRSKKCQQSKDRCNALNSKICSLFTITSHTHVGCDGIVVTKHNDELIFYVCELKSTRASGYIHKFKMAKALILYLCEAAKACGCVTQSPQIQFMLFRLLPPGRKQHMRKPFPGMRRNDDDDLPYLEYGLLANSAKARRKFSLPPAFLKCGE